MEWEWWEGYVKGLIKPLLALIVAAMGMALSYWERLGLEGEMIYAILRSLFQLSVIGFVLQFLFHQHDGIWIILAYRFMVSVAGYTAGERAKHVPRGKYLAGVSILTGTAATLSLLILLDVFPFQPRYVIPIAGLMVGNSMRVTGVALKRFRDDIRIQITLVETALALGATPRQATMQLEKRALILALSPALDNAKTLGLVSLPGALTGLIMGGASPLEAIQLQLIVMNMCVGAATASSIMATYLSSSSFFTEAYQLRSRVFLSD